MPSSPSLLSNTTIDTASTELPNGLFQNGNTADVASTLPNGFQKKVAESGAVARPPASSEETMGAQSDVAKAIASPSGHPHEESQTDIGTSRLSANGTSTVPSAAAKETVQTRKRSRS